MSFGYQMLGFGAFSHAPTPVVHTNTLASTFQQIWIAGGDWLYEGGVTNTQDDDNWFVMNNAYNASAYSLTPYAYDTSDHSISAGSAWEAFNQGGTSHSGVPTQLSKDIGVWAMRSSANGYLAISWAVDMADDLGSFANKVNFDQETTRYAGAYRMDDDTGISFAGSNNPQEDHIFVTYSGGASTVKSAGGPPNGTAALMFKTAFSSPGSSTTYANHGTNNVIIFLNKDDSQTFTDSMTEIDLNHVTWNGTADASLTHVETSDAITLPAHTSSTEKPDLFATSWGNICVHHDTNDASNAKFIPITWSGSTPTVGTAVAWAGGTSIPSHECFWNGVDGIASYARSKYSCGYDRGGTDNLLRTVRLYADGSDMKLDTITVDVSATDGTHELKVKQTAVVTFASSSDTNIWPHFMANNKDLLIWHKDSSTLAYIENAYY